MATDNFFVVKNGLQADKIDLTSPDKNSTISIRMLDSDTLSFSGDSGQLFSITDTQSGTIFAVNDISGVPSIEVDDDGTIRFAETFGNVLVGTAIDDGINKFQVAGGIKASTINTTGDVVVGGDLTVSGTTIFVNTETINLADNIILLNSNATGTATEDAGIEIERGSDTNVTFLWDETNNRWTIGSEGFNAGSYRVNSYGEVINSSGQWVGDPTGLSGETGFTGSQGVIGYTGSRGVIGYTGSQGVIGYTGSQGVIGYTGSQGVIGYTGSKGDTGFTGSQGDQGVIGYTGSQGIQGDTGFTGSQGGDGVIGYTGSRGIIGFTGSRGATGFTGSIGFTGSQGAPGDSGTIGYTGSQGDIGYTGSKGDQGTTGFTGSRGATGFTGSRGVIGYTGSKGDPGDSGTIGYTGSKGEDGNFGGATFDYTFDTATTNSDPGVGNLRFNNSNISLASSMFIDDQDDNATDIQTFLRTIDDSTSTIKGHFRISNRLNADDFAIFTISSISEQTGYFTVNCSYVSGSATAFSDNEDIIITFARTGDRGDIGYTGSKGDPGDSGTIGYTGSQGDTGFTGSKGDQGITGFTGSKGDQGIIGYTGSKGDIGFTGSQGAPGDSGTIGYTGSQGDTGFTGSQGIIGYTGSRGATGFTGSQGVIGYTGSKGDTGFTGSKGETGFVGSVGPIAGTDGNVIYNDNGVAGGSNNLSWDDINQILSVQSNLDFVSPDGNSTISIEMLDGGSLSFEGTSGQLFSITDSLSGTIFSVNDISGIPSIEVDDDGTIRFAEFTGNVLVGTNTDDGINKFQIVGGLKSDTINTSGDVVVGGDLTVSGTTTTINTEEINLADNIIRLNSNYTGSTPTENAGIEVERGTLTNSVLQWNETSDFWEIASGGTTGRILTTADLSSGLDADTLDGQQGTFYNNRVVTSTTAPSSPTDGDLWWDEEIGSLFVYYSDGTSSQWVEASPSADIFTFDSGTNTYTLPGNLTVQGDIDSTSDISLKESVSTLENALEKTLELRGVNFVWKETGKESIGLIAQEVEAVLPELVKESEEGIKSIQYSNIVAVLIEAIKQQNKRIDSLEEQLRK